MRKPRSHEAIRADVTELLAQLKINSVPVPVERIANLLGARVHYSPFEGELAGMLVRREGQTVIGVNSLHHSRRQRFTIAHELGHLKYHEGEIHVDRKLQINRRDANSSLAVDPEEIEANRFAAELLMPFAHIASDLIALDIDVEDDDQIRDLAERYAVSAQAMTHRITNILSM
ncbi:MAG: ImmA/IrrE family metallo-endopeptidase [Rhizomicrobium sp.]